MHALCMYLGCYLCTCEQCTCILCVCGRGRREEGPASFCHDDVICISFQQLFIVHDGANSVLYGILLHVKTCMAALCMLYSDWGKPEEPTQCSTRLVADHSTQKHQSVPFWVMYNFNHHIRRPLHMVVCHTTCMLTMYTYALI